MEITKVVVTDVNGKQHTYEGTGFLQGPLSFGKKTEQYKTQVVIQVNLPEKDVSA